MAKTGESPRFSTNGGGGGREIKNIEDSWNFNGGKVSRGYVDEGSTLDDVQIRSKGCATPIPMTQRVTMNGVI